MMSMLTQKGRWILAILFTAAALLYFFPFVTHQPDGEDAATSLTGFALMSGDDFVMLNGESISDSELTRPDGSERPNDAHYFALILLFIGVGLFMALFERAPLKRSVATLLCALAAFALGQWMMIRAGADFVAVSEAGAISVASGAAWGLKLLLVMLACAFALSILCLMIARRDVASPTPADQNQKLAALSRIAVLGAISAILFFFEVPVIPPIYKLDLSTVPALIAGFAMGPLSGLGVTLVKDLIGLFHTSSMGVGELADFIMSGAMVATASAIYVKKHTMKGALLSLVAGTLAMVAASAVANYFIMIPFYVQVMHMPLDTIVSLIAKTVPIVDTLPKMILLAVVPFNLLKGVVISVITLPLYKRISPMLKRADA